MDDELRAWLKSAPVAVLRKSAAAVDGMGRLADNRHLYTNPEEIGVAILTGLLRDLGHSELVRRFSEVYS